MLSRQSFWIILMKHYDIYIERFETMASRRELKTCLWLEKEMLMEFIKV